MPLHLFFFYATLLLLPAQLGYHFWPDWALVLGRRLDYLSPTIYLTDITIISTLGFYLFSSLNLKYSNILNFKLISNPKLKISNYLLPAGLLVFVGLNIAFSLSPLVSSYKWFRVLEFGLFGFYIVKTKPSFSRSLWCLSFAVLYSSIIAIAQFFLQHSVGGPLWFLGERTFDLSTPGIARIQLIPNSLFLIPYSELLRPYATFPHPNVLGGFLAVTLPLIIFSSMTPLFDKLLLSERAKKLSFVDKAKLWAQKTTGFFNNGSKSFLKLFRVITIILGSTALILTFSRSAWVAGIIGILIALLLHFRSIKNHSFVVFVAFVGFVGLFFALPYFRSLTPSSESVFVRNELSTAAFLIWKTSPLVGVGLGNFLIELPKYYPHREIFFLQPVHNIYLLLLAETGILGFLFLCWLIISIYKNYELRIRNKEGKKQFFIPIIHYSCLPAGMALFILLLLGAVDHYPLTLQQGQLLLTLLISFSMIKS